MMKIAVLGFGNVGAQLGRLWLAKGHKVRAGLREGSKDTVKAKDMGAHVAEPAAAAQGAEVITLALPWGQWRRRCGRLDHWMEGWCWKRPIRCAAT